MRAVEPVARIAVATTYVKREDIRARTVYDRAGSRHGLESVLRVYALGGGKSLKSLILNRTEHAVIRKAVFVRFNYRGDRYVHRARSRYERLVGVTHGNRYGYARFDRVGFCEVYAHRRARGGSHKEFARSVDYVFSVGSGYIVRGDCLYVIVSLSGRNLDIVARAGFAFGVSVGVVDKRVGLPCRAVMFD